MKLTPTEITWLNTKLDTYQIRYQEIYDEIRDHILTAIEVARTNGDERKIEDVYDEILSRQFPGYWPFEDIVKQYQKAYYRKIRQAMKTNFRYYLNWQTIPVITLLIVTGLFLPAGRPTAVTAMVLLTLCAMPPLIYTYRSSRKVTADKGRHSLVKGYVLMQANVLIWSLNVMFNLIATIGREWKPLAFLNPVHYPPVIFMALLSGYIIYGLSCVRLCKQEFRIAD